MVRRSRAGTGKRAVISKRIIPTVLCRGRQMVKGVRFNAWRSVGLAAQAVRVHAMRGVDEVILLDIAATSEGRGPDLELVSELADTLFVPLTVGGGVRSLEDAKALLRAGADKVAICTEAHRRPQLITECSRALGCQAIVAAVDVDSSGAAHTANRHGYWFPGTGPKMAELFAKLGAGEILLTSVDREGTMRGYDLALIDEVAHLVSVPVIAHGGCGTYQHMLEAIEAGADAIAAGAFFQFTDATPLGAAQYLSEHGIETRVRA